MCRSVHTLKYFTGWEGLGGSLVPEAMARIVAAAASSRAPGRFPCPVFASLALPETSETAACNATMRTLPKGILQEPRSHPDKPSGNLEHPGLRLDNP